MRNFIGFPNKPNCGRGLPARFLRLVCIGVFSATSLLAQKPNIAPGGVVNSANLQPFIQPGAWVSIFGSGLSTITRAWGAADFNNGALPTSLDGVSVTVGGRAAFVAYVSPSQINVEVASDTPTGLVGVTVTNHGSTSDPAMVNTVVLNPALFRLGAHGGRYAAALINSGGSVRVAASDALYGRSEGFATAAQGQTLSVYGTGFGPTRLDSPAGSIFTGAYDLASPATATIGGVPAKVLFAGRVAVGLDQVNVVIPAVPDGDYPLVISINGQASQPDVFLSIGAGVNAAAPGVYNPIAKAQNSTLFLGDSISYSPQDFVNGNWAAQTFVRSGAEVLKLGDAGVPGNATAQMLARVPDVIALSPANCVVMGGTNDLGLDLALTLANIDQIVKELQQNGIRPILGLLPPRTGGTANVLATNTVIQRYAIKNGLPYVDFFAVLADPVTGDYLPGYSTDGIHPSETGAAAMASTFLKTTQRLFIPVPSFLPTNSNGGQNMLGPNVFVPGTGGDGLANGWTVSGGAGSLMLSADSDGVNWQSITTQSSFQIARQYIYAGPQTFSDGDRVAFVGRVKLSTPVGATGTINLNLIQGSGTSIIWPLAKWSTNIEDAAIYHEFTIPANTEFMNIFAGVDGAGANLRIAQFGLYNLTKRP